MFVTNMRPFQSLYFKYPQIHKLYRTIHTTHHRLIIQPSTVSTFYDPVTERLVTQRIPESKHTESESESDQNPNQLSNSDYADALKDDISYGSVANSNLSQGSGPGRSLFGVSKKKGKTKSKSTWVCSECGYTDGQWWGYCRECKNVNTMKEFKQFDDGGKTSGFSVSEKIVLSWLPKGTGEAVPLRLMDVNRGVNHMTWRLPL